MIRSPGALTAFRDGSESGSRNRRWAKLVAEIPNAATPTGTSGVNLGRHVTSISRFCFSSSIVPTPQLSLRVIQLTRLAFAPE